MKTNVESSTRKAIVAACVLLSAAFVLAPSASLQEGGTFVLKPSVVPGGGGTSANASTNIAGTIGQAVLGLSSGGSFSLNAGFWQGASPCAVPGISSHPSSQSVCENASVNFSVTVSDTGVTYQWRKNGADITGANSSSLSLNNASSPDAASYDVVVSKPCGSSATSNPAVLTVNIYSLAPDSATFLSSGGTGGFNVNVAGSCPWTAVTSDAWITITAPPGGIGAGNGAVSYSVGANSGTDRTGRIVVAGKNFTVKQDAPTAVTLISFSAKNYDNGVLIEWQTGLEVDNLGFNVYREEGGTLSRVNSQLLAGSALKVGQGVTLTSGYSYSTWDDAPATKATRYWLEDVDLNGVLERRGPIFAESSSNVSRPAAVEQARTLAELGKSEATSAPIESRATPSPAGYSLGAAQTQSLIASSANGVKLAVRREAWYSVSAHELFDAGLDTSVDPQKLQLFVDGKQQAIRVTGHEDGRFDLTDSVEFYGTGTDSPFTDLRTYYLVAGKQAGLRISTIQSPANPSPSGGFEFTVERRDRTIYFAALRNGDKENFFGPVVVSQPVSQSLTLNHLVPSAKPATLKVGLQGVTKVSHLVNVRFNGGDVGQLSFQGQAEGTKSFSVSPSLLREGGNQVTLTAQSGPSDVSLVAYVELTYQHSFTADDGALKVQANARRQITIDGFNSEAIEVLDVTDPYAVQEVAGFVSKDDAGGYAVSFIVPGKGERALLALTKGNTSSVDRLVSDYPSGLRSNQQGSDLLIVTRREFVDAARGLKEFREKQGLSVSVVDIEDIYDEFSFGQKTPLALKDFIGFAMTNWKKPIKYVLFFGDASLDPKSYLGLGDFDLVPTRLIDTMFMETASDDWLADFTEDGIADIAVGRLPVRTVDEARSVLKKIISYEQSSSSEQALLVSDLSGGFDFEGASEQLVPLLPQGFRVALVNRGRLGDQAARAAVLDAITRGQRIVNYFGHGSANVWRGGLLSSDDAAQLLNADHLAMFVMMNCLNGYFLDPTMDSLGEALLESANGGAVAVWASSGMTFANGQLPMNQEFYRQVFANRARVGDAAIRAKKMTLDLEVRRTWILLADPTMRLR